MSTGSKRTHKYKESPYGGYAQPWKADNKPCDGKSLDDSKLPKLGTQLNVWRLNRSQSTSSGSWNNHFDHKTGNGSESEALNEGSKVPKIVSGFEKISRGSRESKKASLSSSIMMEEDPLHEENDKDMGDALVEGSRSMLPQEKRVVIDDHLPPNGSSGLHTQHPKSLYGSFEARPFFSDVLNDKVPRPHHITSGSKNSFPEPLEDATVSTISTHPKLLEHVGSAREFRDLGKTSYLKKLEMSTSMRIDIKENSLVEACSLTHPFQHVEVHILGSKKMNAEIYHDFETTSHTHRNLPMDAYNSLAFLLDNESDITSKENEDISRQVTISREAASSYEKSMTFEKGKPNPLEASRKVVGGQEKIRSKDHYASLKITGTDKDEKVILSGVASSFYNGGSLALHAVLSCPSITKINEFLAERRNELLVGVPGKWLTVVLGGESSELSTIVATIMYAYFREVASTEENICIVPIVNMSRGDLALHPDVTWLFTSIGLNTAALLFIDEINLSYFHRFGSLRLVLINDTMLSPSQENLKDDVEEILAIHEEVDTAYPHLKAVISDEDVGSSCTIIVESVVKHHPELLAGRAISRLLLAGILLDTKDLRTVKTTRRDVSMATLLLNGAGTFGRSGLFKILKQKCHDLSNMNTNQILRKQFKKLKLGSLGEKAAWKRLQHGVQFEESVGMSSLPIPLSEVLAWEEDAPQIIVDFPSYVGLSLFVLVTGYYETLQTFKREVLLVAKDNVLIENISSFLLENKGVKFMTMLIPGLPSCMRGYSLEGTRISRTAIQSIIKGYFV